MIVISLFSGCDGLGLGLEQEGFDRIIAQEKDKAATATLRKNNRPVVAGDILKLIKADRDCNFLVTKSERGNVFAVIGGIPCQPWSFAGKRLGLKDDRGLLYKALLHVVKTVRPRFFVLENVKGFASAHGVLKKILRDFRRIGYTMVWGVMNAADFGTPQNRERLIIIGSRDGEEIFLPVPTHVGRHRTFEDAIEGLVDTGVGAKFTPKVLRFIRHVPEGGNWRSLSSSLQKIALGGANRKAGGCTGYYRRLSWDKPSPTLMTSPTQRSTLLAHPTEDRPLSVAEYARIQGFPDSYRFEGSVADQYKQIGNAVPIELARAIGRVLRQVAGM